MIKNQWKVVNWVRYNPRNVEVYRPWWSQNCQLWLSTQPTPIGTEHIQTKEKKDEKRISPKNEKRISPKNEKMISPKIEKKKSLQKMKKIFSKKRNKIFFKKWKKNFLQKKINTKTTCTEETVLGTWNSHFTSEKTRSIAESLTDGVPVEAFPALLRILQKGGRYGQVTELDLGAVGLFGELEGGYGVVAFGPAFVPPVHCDPLVRSLHGKQK